VAAARSERPHDRGRVLVVEDNATNQMVATGMLSSLGFNVEVVSDGHQAVEAVASSEYATVLMDCNMPVMDGYAATAAIRRWEATVGVHVPIVAMTASALVGDRERCLAVGMDDYLSKPVTLSDLERVLSRWRPAGQPAGAADPIDGDQLDGLRALDDGDGLFLARLVESFLGSAEACLRGLGEAVESGDAAAVSRLAHRFKGEASTLGATDLAAVCGELESVGSPLDVGAARDLLVRVERETERARVRLQAEVGTDRQS
jgi:CheY-like chemotaxis protein/HPt (histidine-containing phosphotransfer) domain-containing protein